MWVMALKPLPRLPYEVARFKVRSLSNWSTKTAESNKRPSQKFIHSDV